MENYPDKVQNAILPIFHTDASQLIHPTDRPANQSLDRYQHHFDFLEMINYDKQSFFKEGGFKELNFKSEIESKAFLADFSASVAAQFITTPESLRKYSHLGLDCCRDILTREGLKENYIYDLSELTRIDLKSTNDDQRPHNVILVVGAQNQDILKNRANAAARVYYELTRMATRELSIYVSGQSPPTKGESGEVRNHNILFEYERLAYFFIKEIRKLLTEKSDVKNVFENLLYVEKETKSLNTKQNINAFFQQFLDQTYNKQVNLFVVSSNFHLIRISEAIRQYLSDETIQKRSVAQKITYNKILFVGAEDYDFHKDIIEKQEYRKAMYFEILFYFLKNRLM